MTGGREPGASSPTEGDGAFAGLSVLLVVEDDAWTERGLGDLEALTLSALSAAARQAGLPADLETEVSLTFASDAAIQAINAEWRGKDSPTNVLSFPIEDLEPGETPGPILGDIVLALETIEREAEAEEKSLSDHLCHLIVHGFLHCLGFDHEETDEAEEMECLEIAILGGLGISDPYALVADATRDDASTDGAPRRWAS